MRKEPIAMSGKYKFSATTSLKIWFSLPKILIFFFIFTISSFNSFSSSATPDELSYADHCASIVPESTPKAYAAFGSAILHHTGFYIIGSSGGGLHSNTIKFNVWSIKETGIQDVLSVQGSLEFESNNHHLWNVTRHLPQSFVRFEFSGFSSLSSGNLCMVGSGSIKLKQGDLSNDVPALLQLNNLINFTSISSLISGTLESLKSSQNDTNYFEPISIMILPRINYQYSLVSNISNDDSSSGGTEAPSGSLQLERFCSLFSRIPVQEFDLKYSSHCLSAKNCTSPLSGFGLLPHLLTLRDIECLEDQRRLRVLVEFSEKTESWYERSLYPNRTFVGEGSWNAKKNQLHVVACRFLDVKDLISNSHVGDCSIRLSLSFPGIWTIGDTRTSAGHIWSSKAVTELGYFENITFDSHETRVGGRLLKGQKYEYTQIDKVTKLCPRKIRTAANDQNTNSYPSPFPYGLSFDMVGGKSEGGFRWGYSSPLSVGNWLPGLEPYSIKDTDSTEYNSSSPYSVSYKVFIGLGNTSVTNLISAEGIYDYKEGKLCMVGCRNLGSTDQQPTNDSVDCEILINVLWPPINPARKNPSFLKGSIISMREKSDPLHFDRLELSPADKFMADSNRRMEVEVILILISITLACVFGVSQLFHVQRHPDVLPSISILMLLILTLGYMIPLMHYFEASFMDNSDLLDSFLARGQRIQLSQFIVRVMTIQTLVALLLQLRLLQKIWSARSAKGIYKQVWDVEKKAVSAYALGVLVVMLLLMSSKLQKHFWSVIRGSGAYAGLVVDGFLLPQVLLNMICNSKEKALSVSYYTGTTFVGLLPHAYDLYKIHISVGIFAQAENYASPLVGSYSTTWHIMTLIEGLLLAVIIFFQQKYGGHCFLPKKLRELGY